MARLNMLPCLHLPPINPIVSRESLEDKSSVIPSFRDGFTLRCFQRLSKPNVATQLLPLVEQLIHERFVLPGPLVLGKSLFKYLHPRRIGDRTVSRRSEPSSRTALIDEQSNPWDLLQPQDAMSRHRGAKPPRRCELLEEISLLSPEYLLSVERWPFHTEPPDHYDLSLIHI